MLLLWNNIVFTNYFNYQPRFNRVLLKQILPRIKDGAYLTNVDDKNSKETHSVSLSIDRNTALFFDFGIEYISPKVLNKIRDKSITHNIFRIQDDDCVKCGFYCIAFIEYMLAEKALLDYTNLFSSNDCEKNDKIIYRYFGYKYGRRSRHSV